MYDLVNSLGDGYETIAHLERVTEAVEGLVGPDWEYMWFQKEAKDKSK